MFVCKTFFIDKNTVIIVNRFKTKKRAKIYTLNRGQQFKAYIREKGSLKEHQTNCYLFIYLLLPNGDPRRLT